MARESQDGLLVYLGISAAVHLHRGCLPFRGGKRPNRNLGRYGQLGIKDSQFPVNQEIQGPVLHAFTMDRKFYEDCTYWNPFWGSTPGLPTSNIHDLGKWGPILGTGRLISPAHFQEQIAPTSVNKGRNRPNLYFGFGFVVANGWIAQNLSINGYSGGFGYHLATGVTIVVEATKSEATKTDAAAFDILRAVTKYVVPATPINFQSKHENAGFAVATVSHGRGQRRFRRWAQLGGPGREHPPRQSQMSSQRRLTSSRARLSKAFPSRSTTRPLPESGV